MSSESSSVSRLSFFPIMMFAVIMGLSGLTLIVQKASHVLGYHEHFAYLFQSLVTVIFIIIFIVYVTKFIFHTRAVLSELSHPVRINFFAALPISFLLLSVIYTEFQSLSIVLFMIGMVIQTILAFYTIAFWINKNMEIEHSNPAWFIPVVGNLLIPLAGASYLSTDFLMFYFSFGLFFWLILTSILFNRIIFHKQLPQKFLPTLSIFIAPPAIAMLAYLRMFHSYDIFAMILLNLSIFFAILIFVLSKNFYKIKFYLSWWAFTFPFAALTLALLTAYESTNILTYRILGTLAFVLTFIIVIVVSYKTIIAIKHKEICKEEA